MQLVLYLYFNFLHSLSLRNSLVCFQIQPSLIFLMIRKNFMQVKNGWHLPANGTVRVLFVFVEIDYDTGIDPNPNGTNEWPVNALPVWANNFLDPQIPTGQSNGLLTQYYREASLGNYNLIGDYLIAPDNGGVFMILKSYANSVGHENAAINKINPNYAIETLSGGLNRSIF